MTRGTRQRVLRVRYKGEFGTRSRLVVGRVPKGIPGRILKVGKVSNEELFHVGEFNQMPKRLMREFKAEGGGNSFERKMKAVEVEVQELNKDKEIKEVFNASDTQTASQY